MTIMTASQVAEAVNRGEISARRLIEEAIEKNNSLNHELKTFTALSGSEALEKAELVDQKIKSGLALPLAGVALAVDDNFCCRQLPMSMGLQGFEDFYPPYDAAAVETLTAAGAVLIGKLRTDEAGDDQNLTGSAGAIALKAGQCHLALVNDNSGLHRREALDMKLFAMRPSPGRVSRHGLHMSSSSFGQSGIIASCPEDLLIALKALSGFDARDASTALYRDHRKEPGNAGAIENLTVGFPEAVFKTYASPQAEEMNLCRNRINENGGKLVPVRVDLLEAGLRAFYTIAYCEASSNLSRYDGIRYGTAADADNLDQLYAETRGQTLGREARRRSAIGTFLLSGDQYNRYYRQALKVWQSVRNELSAALEECDLLILPATHHDGFEINLHHEITDHYSRDLFTAYLTLSGMPVLSWPLGSDHNQRAGLQLVTKPFHDEFLIAAAKSLFREVQ